MEREIIAAMVASLSPTYFGELPTADEIWEEVDGGAILSVARNILPGLEENKEFISLSVKGDPDERHRVLDEFVAVFGPPVSPIMYSDDPKALEIAAWRVYNP